MRGTACRRGCKLPPQARCRRQPVCAAAAQRCSAELICPGPQAARRRSGPAASRAGKSAPCGVQARGEKTTACMVAAAAASAANERRQCRMPGCRVPGCRVPGRRVPGCRACAGAQAPHLVPWAGCTRSPGRPPSAPAPRAAAAAGPRHQARPLPAAWPRGAPPPPGLPGRRRAPPRHPPPPPRRHRCCRALRAAPLPAASNQGCWVRAQRAGGACGQGSRFGGGHAFTAAAVLRQ